MRKNTVESKALLLGLGLDGKDGHIRITKGPNFRLLGGSEDTHATMQDKVMDFNKELGRKKKTLDEINREEFAEIADKIGLKPYRKPQN